jgi:hypothetical protein
MGNQEILVTLGTQDTTQQSTKMSNTDPTKMFTGMNPSAHKE